MTLNSLLKVTGSTKINITLPEEEKFFTYKIDYLKKGYEVENYGCFENHKTIASLPTSLLKRKVERVDTNPATDALEIRIK